MVPGHEQLENMQGHGHVQAGTITHAFALCDWRWRRSSCRRST